MAEVAAIMVGPDANGVVTVTWSGINTTDTSGAPVRLAHLSDKTVHSDGSFSGTGSITMQGSNNNTAWFTLNSPLDDPVSLTADTVGMAILENPLWIRPLLASGDGSTDIDVTVVCAPRKT